MDDIQRFTSQYRDERIRAQAELERSEQETALKKRREVSMWISAAKAEQDHESFCNERHGYPETGKWILAHDRVQNWREEELPESSIVWVNGKPGAGRTVPLLSFYLTY